MIRHFAGVGEVVEDLDAAVAFYRDVLGFDVAVGGELPDDYAELTLDGLMHFGIWTRAALAAAILGSGERADEIPLGWFPGFEVDDVAAAEAHAREQGAAIVQPNKTQPWEIVTCNFLLPGGQLGEFSETPWRRTLNDEAAQ